MNEHVEIKTEEITFKDFVQIIKKWIIFILSHWIKITIIGFLGGVIGFIYAGLQPLNYTARLTFVVEDAKGSGNLGGLASLAGQFGVDFGSGGNSGLLSGDNIILYLKSQSIVREVLLSAYDDKRKVSVADFYCEVTELKTACMNDKKIGNVNFPIKNSNVIYSRIQDSLLQQIIEVILLGKISVERIDKKAGFIAVSSTFQNEKFAKLFCEKIVDVAIKRYINTKTLRQKNSVEKLQARADSVSRLLNQKTLSSAQLQTSTTTMDLNPIYKTGLNVASESTIRDKTILSTIFASITQNLELAKFALSQETPVIQIVDYPILPLKKIKMSRLKTAIALSIFSAFIFIIFLMVKRVYK